MTKTSAAIAPKSRPAPRPAAEAPAAKAKVRPDAASWSRFVAATGRIRIGGTVLRRG